MGKFSKSKFKAVLITPDKIISDENIIRLFSIMPVKGQKQARFDTMANYQIYEFIYNELLKDYLIREKDMILV